MNDSRISEKKKQGRILSIQELIKATELIQTLEESQHEIKLKSESLQNTIKLYESNLNNYGQVMLSSQEKIEKQLIDSSVQTSKEIESTIRDTAGRLNQMIDSTSSLIKGQRFLYWVASIGGICSILGLIILICILKGVAI